MPEQKIKEVKEVKETTPANAALEMARQIYEDKCATINGRDYFIANVNHLKRRKVFSYFTHIQNDLKNKDFWFIESSEWADVESTINSVVLFDDQSMSKRQDHWDTYPEDYFLYIQSMMPALSYPFLKGLSGN